MAKKARRVQSPQVLVIAADDEPVSQAVLQATRLRILTLLASPETERRDGLSLQDISNVLGCSPQNAHHHLRILARHGFVEVVREEPTQRIPRQFWSTPLREIRFEDALSDGPGRLRIAFQADKGT